MASATANATAQRKLGALVASRVLTVGVTDPLDQWIEQVAALITAGGRASASLASKQYLDARTAAGIVTAFTPTIGEPAPLEQISSSLRWAMYAPGDSTPQTRLTGLTQRYVMTPGRTTIVDSASADKQATGYARVPRPGCCAFCALLSTRDPGIYKSATTALKIGNTDQPYHDNCVVGDTLISAPGAEIGYRRHYEGEVIVIRTTAGNELTVTPNHPILTDQGWVPAGLLHVGQYVVGSLGGHRDMRGVPEVEHAPTAASDLFETLGMMRATRRASMPSAAEQFHGDGCEGEIDVVTADGLLADGVGAPLYQPLVEDPFSRTGAVSPSSLLAAIGLLEDCLVGAFGTSDGGMGSFGNGGSLLGRALFESHSLSCPSPSGIDVCRQQMSADDVTTGAVLLGKRQFGSAFDVLAGDSFDVELERSMPPIVSKFDPTGDYGSAEGYVSYANQGSRLRERLARQVELDRVVELRRVGYSGHVFNFQTAEGWYGANGIVASNCHCIAVPIFEGQTYTPPAHVQEAERIYAASTGHVTGAAKITEFRKAWGGN